jgi:hypothetical protein
LGSETARIARILASFHASPDAEGKHPARPNHPLGTWRRGQIVRAGVGLVGHCADDFIVIVSGKGRLSGIKQPKAGSFNGGLEITINDLLAGRVAGN